MEGNNSEFNILSLPDEVITIILSNKKLCCRDVLNFSETCKYFRDVVIDNPCLWKKKSQITLPLHIFEVINSYCDGKWLNELKSYLNLRKYIHSELIQMSPKFYRREIEIDLSDVRNFFKVALSRSVNYYITASVLTDVLKEGYSYPNCNMEAKHPYTFTDMYYARIILRYLIHAFLMLDWVQSCTLNEMPPEKVVNFFLQWTDTGKLHLKQDTDKVIQNMVAKVENVLESSHPLKNVTESDREDWKKGCLENNQWSSLENRQVLSAIKHVLYQETRMTVTPGTNLQSLDIEKAMVSRFGNATAIAALISAVARRCGVRCDLVAFPNHMFLEWREDYSNPGSEAFSINLGTGELERKRRCPFSQANAASYKYDSHSLLQYLYATFNRTMGAIRDWSTQNAVHLMNFISVNTEELRPYRHMLSYLTRQTAMHDAALNAPLDFKCQLISFPPSTENLREVARPVRLYHLEDILSREFSHFDGFAYIPNEEKEAEYPQDWQQRSFYRTKGTIVAQ